MSAHYFFIGEELLNGERRLCFGRNSPIIENKAIKYVHTILTFRS